MTKPLPVPVLKNLKATSIKECNMIFGNQSQRLIPAIHNKMCQTESLSAGLVVMAPLKVARPHIHRHCESILYFTEGWFATLYGEDLEVMFHGPGDLLFIPQNVVHVGINLSSEHRAIALEVRTDPAFNDDVVVAENFIERVAVRAAELQKQFKKGTLALPADWKKRGYGPYEFEEQDEHKKIGILDEV